VQRSILQSRATESICSIFAFEVEVATQHNATEQQHKSTAIDFWIVVKNGNVNLTRTTYCYLYLGALLLFEVA
jgi:hypothetical protein